MQQNVRIIKYNNRIYFNKQMELPKDQFVPPQGWRWDGDWYVSPELR